MSKIGKTGERFETIYFEPNMGASTKVLKDKETGVMYVYHRSSKGGGMTVLVDEYGKPLVDKSE